MRVFILFIALIIGSVAGAYPEPLKFNHIIIDNVWIKDTPPNHKTTAGYLTIENLGDTDEILLSVSSSFAAKGEIHQMKMDGEVMKMRPIPDGLIIPAGESIYLKPGSFHLMFMKLNMQIIPMQTLELTLTFKNLGSVIVPATVKSAPASDNANSKKHNH